jgi:hypothetical protein
VVKKWANPTTIVKKPCDHSYEYGHKYGGKYYWSGSSCGCEHEGTLVTYTYQVTNNGAPLLFAVGYDDKLGYIFGDLLLKTGETKTFTRTVKLNETTTNTFKVGGFVLGSCDVCKAYATATVTATEEEPSCKPCSGKVSELTLKYTGYKTAYVVIKQKNGDKVFAGYVKPGEQFTIKGTYYGTLGSQIVIYVNGYCATSIDTSCASKIGPGLVRGSFKVVSGESKYGGQLCPIY